MQACPLAGVSAARRILASSTAAAVWRTWTDGAHLVKVTVRFQGIIADMLGRKSVLSELPDTATVADLVSDLTRDDETAFAVLKQTRPFIDGKQAERSAPLHDGAEVIFMRPIAGG
jgi:molybdopterin converting factor small subunit